MTAQMSRERLEALANLQSLECMALPASHAESAEMARMLLAGMSSEPRVYIGKQMLESLCDEGGRTCGRVWRSDTDELSRESRIPLYAAPPAPVAVPTFEEWCQMEDMKPLGWVREAMKEAYYGCRAAMLSAAPQPKKAQQNIPENIPAGWTGNCDADAALVMLDRIDTVDCADDERIESVKSIIRRLAAAPEQEV